VPLAEFELAIAASEQPQTDALENATIGIDRHMLSGLINMKYVTLYLARISVKQSTRRLSYGTQFGLKRFESVTVAISYGNVNVKCNNTSG